MNIKSYLLLSLLLFVCISCNSKANKKNNLPNEAKKDTTVVAKDRETEDSARLKEALEKAVHLVKENQEKEAYKYRFWLASDSTTFDIATEIFTGNLFDDGNDYALIKRKFIDRVYVNIYKKKAGDLEKMMNYENDYLNYIGDTIVDVNGDNRKDFVMHQYPNSGCCLANIKRVFLNLENDFAHEYEFMNPTFFPKQKIIRGVGYGHPGQTDLYTYKWNHLIIDTLEYIQPNVEEHGHYFKIKKGVDGKTALKQLPMEYQNIKHIDWFLDHL